MRKPPMRKWRTRVHDLRLMYLFVERVEYIPLWKKRRIRHRRIKECLNGHQAGCQCWKRVMEEA